MSYSEEHLEMLQKAYEKRYNDKHKKKKINIHIPKSMVGYTASLTGKKSHILGRGSSKYLRQGLMAGSLA